MVIWQLLSNKFFKRSILLNNSVYHCKFRATSIDISRSTRWVEQEADGEIISTNIFELGELKVRHFWGGGVGMDGKKPLKRT